MENIKRDDLDSKVMLSTTDVAQLLGVHPNTVRRWDARGILKSYRISSRGDRRFRRRDIDVFLNERESQFDSADLDVSHSPD